MTGEERQNGKSHYLIGHDSAQWRKNIPHFGRVQVRNVYPGIDLVYYGNQRRIEHDFIVSPGADPKDIQWEITGSTHRKIDKRGNLVLMTPGGEIALQKPACYQRDGGRKQPVEGHFVLSGKNLVSFEVGDYRRDADLIIDPVLEYSTYLGGSASDLIMGIAVDVAGCAYVTGSTASADFPLQTPFQGARNGSSDAFVAKINAAGSVLVYSTYLGGSAGDSGSSIAVDGSGNVYVAGRTSSADFPVQNPPQAASGGGTNDAFICKINAAGSALVYSTYLGGNGDDSARGLALDGTGNAYVTGRTDSTNFPIQSPLQAANAGNYDVFVAELNAAGTAWVYSTYLGGSGIDEGYAIAADGSGNAYLTGLTYSNNFPLQNPFQATLPAFDSAFVTKIDTGGASLAYSTYLGGTYNLSDPSGTQTLGSGIAVDGTGCAYVTGWAACDDFPLQNPIQGVKNGLSNGFVTKFDPTGTALVYSTYLGGNNVSSGNAIALDGAGNAFVTGFTYSSDFPLVEPIQSINGGGGGVPFGGDAFVAKINAAGTSWVYSTYLGGSNDDNGNSIAVDGAGNAYVAGRVLSTDFPLMNPIQAANAGVTEAFVAKISPATPLPTPTATTTPTPTATPSADNFYVSKNAFRPGREPVTILVEYPYPGDLSLRVYNSAGELVKKLEEQRFDAPISQTYTWDGTNHAEEACASGVYFFYLSERFDRKIKRILLVK